MKKTTLLLIFFSTFTVFSQNINGRITYNHSVDPISEKKLDSIVQNGKSKDPKMQKMMRDIFKNMPDVKSFLDFNNGESLFYVEEKMQNDGKSLLNMNRIFAGGDDKYYKNTHTKEYFKEYKRELLLIELEPKKWQITQESKKIGEYLCYKAIDIASTNTKMKPIVWFTPQIPVSFGPLEYSGLPGLVLQVEMSNRTIIATTIVLNPKKEIKIIKPTKGKKMTAEEFRKKTASFWKNLQKTKD